MEAANYRPRKRPPENAGNASQRTAGLGSSVGPADGAQSRITQYGYGMQTRLASFISGISFVLYGVRLALGIFIGAELWGLTSLLLLLFWNHWDHMCTQDHFSTSAHLSLDFPWGRVELVPPRLDVGFSFLACLPGSSL